MGGGERGGRGRREKKKNRYSVRLARGPRTVFREQTTQIPNASMSVSSAGQKYPPPNRSPAI